MIGAIAVLHIHKSTAKITKLAIYANENTENLAESTKTLAESNTDNNIKKKPSAICLKNNRNGLAFYSI